MVTQPASIRDPVNLWRWHCTVPWEEDAPRSLQCSSMLKSPLLPVMESSSCTPACRHGRQAQHNHPACGQSCSRSASLLDMWHFWLLQSMKCWKGKLPRATPSLKCFTAASSKVRWCISLERRLQSPCVQQLISDSATTQFCLSRMCQCWCTKKCTPGHSSFHVPDSWEEDGAEDGAVPWQQQWRFKFQRQSAPKGSRRWILTLWTLS